MALKRKVTIIEEDNTSKENILLNQQQEHSFSDDDIVNEDKDGNAVVNEGWADSIAKILKTNKPKGKKTLVLSKAKKLTDLHKTKTKDAGYEIQAEDGQVKPEQILEESSDESDKEQPLKKKKKEYPDIRIKPNILEKNRERTLSKIATRGVVKLFNAVRMQQKDIDNKLKEAGPLEVKRDKVLKNLNKTELLKVLTGANKPGQIEKGTKKVEVNKTEESVWSVLRDDFMMGAKMKDWDKELESENEIEKEIVESE